MGRRRSVDEFDVETRPELLIQVLSNARAVLERYHTLEGAVEPGTDRSGASSQLGIDAELHAGCIPFEKDGERIEAMLKIWDADLNRFDMARSTFSNMLEKRIAVLESFLAAASSPQSVDATQNTSVQGVPPPLASMTLPRSSLSEIEGSDPSTWPETLKALVKAFAKMEILQLRNESCEAATQFLDASQKHWQLALASEEPDQHAQAFVVQRIVSVLTMFAVLYGSLHSVLVAIRILLEGASMFPSLTMQLSGNVHSLGRFQAQLDLSLPWNKAVFSTWSEPGSAPKRDAAKGKGIATDGNFLYIHNGCGLHKVGTGLHGTVRGHVYAHRKNYRNKELVHLACINKTLYALSNQFEWPFVDAIDCSELNDIGLVQLGYDPETSVPEKRADSLQFMISDGAHLYLFDQDSQEENSRKDTGSDSSTRMPQIAIYVYETSPDNDRPESGGRTPGRFAQETKALAQSLWKNFAYRFPLSLCTIALKVSRNDPNAAGRWLLNHGSSFDGCSRVRLCRRFLLQPMSGLTIGLLSRSLVYVTGHQLVVVIPPYTNDCNDSSEWLGRVFDCHTGNLIAEQSGGISATGLNACYDAVNDVIWNSHLPSFIQFQALHNHGPRLQLSNSLLPGFAAMSVEAMIEGLGNMENPRLFDVAVFLMCHAMRCLKQRSIMEPESNTVDDESGNDHPKSKKRSRRKLSRAKKQANAARSPSGTAPSPYPSTPLCFELSDKMFNELLTLSKNLATMLLAMDPGDKKVPRTAFLLISTFRLLRYHFEEIVSVSGPSECTPIFDASSISDHLQRMLVSPFPLAYCSDIRQEAGLALTAGFRLLFLTDSSQMDFISQTIKSALLLPHQAAQSTEFSEQLMHWLAQNIQDFEFVWRLPLDLVELVFELCAKNPYCNGNSGSHALLLAIVNAYVTQLPISSASPPEMSTGWLVAFSLRLFEQVRKLVDYRAAHEEKLGGIRRQNSRAQTDLQASIIAILPTILPSLGIVIRDATLSSAQILHLLSSTSTLISSFNNLNKALPSSAAEDRTYCDNVATELRNEVVVESSHPYANGANVIRETIYFPTSHAISITFDPRCSTKDHMDQLVFYTDVAMNCRAPIGPFFGNEQDRNANWLKRPVIIAGSTLSLSFSARSQPRDGDKTRWGFRCAFRGISFTTLSFTLDVQSLLCSAAGLFCSSLIRGPPVVDSESFFDDWVHRSLITEGLERYDLDDDDAKALRLCPVVVNDDSSSNCFSKSDSVLRSIIDGTASSLLTLLQQHEYRFIGNHLIRSLPTPIQQDWQRCIRAVMACMIKHSGLLFEFLQATRKHENCFSEGENGADGPSLYDKFRMVSVSAQSLQDWMLHQVQAIRRWHTFLVDHHQPTVTQLNEEFGHSDDHFNLLAICGYLGVDTTSLDSSGSDLNPVFSAIAELTAASPISVSPYEYICGHVSRAAEELMMFKASFPESDFPDSSLDVPDIWRSRSVATNLNSTAQSPIMRTLSVPVLPRDNALTALPAAQKGFESRVHHLRTSIQNYQHWKLWRQTVSQSAASARKDSPMSPLESILGLVRRRMKPNQMLKIAHTHYLRLRYRIAGLHTLSELVRSICFGSSRIALLGRLQSSLRESSCNSAASLEAGVCCCPSVWRESLLASFGSLFSTLIVFISDGSAPLAVRMLAFRDVYGIDFDAHHCRLIETWRMLDNVTNVVMHPKVNLSITSKGSTKVQEDFLDAVWAALRLVAFRMLRFSADDLQDDIALSVVLLDVKRFQRTVFQSLLSILRHFLGISSADESQRIASNRYIQRVASLLMLVSPLPSISLLNRPEFLQCFAVVLKHPAYYPLRVVRLIVRLARTVLSVVSPMSVVELFPDHFPTLLIRVIADLVVSDAEPNTKSKFCVIAHPSPGMNQAWWVRIVTHEIPELVSGSPPMDDPSFQLAEQLHREEAEQAYAIRSTYRSGPDSIPLKEIGGGSVQFLADNVVICKDGFATVVGEVSITSGRWYFELILQSSGVMQVGWCTLDMVASSSSGNGIGDDRRSWAYDGRRLSKWHGDQSRYSSKRWQAGDVVGVAIDLHDRVMRYYLNGVDLGIAFSGLEEIGEHGGVRPACSFAAGERARFVFDATQFRSSLPEGYFPLEGDKPMPRNNPLGRSHSIWCDLTQLGQAVVWRDNSDGCLSMASRLSRHGAIVTVVREASLESCSNKGASTVHNVFRLNGRGARAMASEFISLARFLLSPTLCTRAWSESLSSTINAVIEAYKDVADTSATSRLLLGCLCVLGGFSEPLRIGGYVDIDDEIGGRNLGVILDSIPGSAVVSVAMLDRPLDATMSSSNLGTSLRGSVTTVRKPSVVDTTSDPATRTSLAHRIRVDKIRTRSEFDVDLMNDFPLSKTHVACFISLSSIQQHSEGRWMLLELQLRSMLVLESLLRLANTDDSPSIRLATKHFRGLARSSSWRNFQYERVRNVVERSRDRVWDLSSDCFGWFAQPPVPGTTSNTAFEELCETSTPSASVDSNELFVYGSSCYLEQSGVGAIADDTSIQRMVRYWESRIIPHIQDYVRGSFRDYEMVYFFEQLRQPLRAGDVASAMKIVYTLCNQRVPDTVQFPALDHDWSQLMAEDISVGQALYVAQPSRSVSDGLDGGLPLQMANRIGTVQAVRPEKDLVMLQVYFEDEAILRSAWFPVNVLREPEQMDSVGSTESVDSIRTISDALEFLQSALAPLPVLLARRSIVSLCSQTSHFIANQLQAARDPGELLFASLSQCLQCSLPNVGTALVEHVATIERFERNLADALASSDAQFADQILDFMEKSLTTASAFLSSNTRVVLSGIDSLPQPYFTPGAASFVVEFAQDAFLPANTTFSVFADAECTRPIRHYVGGKSGCGRLQHCTVEGDRFWMRAGERPDASAFEGFRVRVTALSPDFALSFWIIRFLMEHSLPCFGENRSRIAFESIVRLFARFDLVHMAPSPVKQVILALVYDLVGLCETTSYLSNQDIAQSALVHIAELQPELIGLLADETVKPVFTSYVQQLLDLQVRADYLRHPDIRLAKSFDPGSPLSFGSEPADDGAAEDVPVDNSWACPICTLVNEDSSAICCACENPRPAVVESASLRETAPLSPYTVDRLREAASTRFDHVVGLVGIMKWLLGVVDIDACAPSQAILHAAWEVSRRESIQPRLVVVDGIPITHTESDARAHLLRSLEKVSAISGVPYLVDLESIFFGFNPELPPSDTLEDAATFLSQAPKMVVFEHDFPLDNNGIVWYLGTRACTEPFTNPVHLGLVGVTASSLQHDSTSADAVVGRDVVRCVTTPAENQWFEIEFKDMLISPTHYTLRHYISWHTEALRNWRFEALGSDGNWICLHEAVNDESLSAKGAAHTWHLPPVPTGQESSFSKFRIFMTGLNSNKHWYLALSGFEIYGSVTSESIVQKLPIRSSNRFAVFQLLNGSSPDVLDSLVNGLNGSVLEWPDWFRSRVTIQRFIDIPETDARITTYLKSRLVNVESSSLTEGFRNAIGEIFGAKTIRESHRLLLSPTTLEQVSFAAHWPLPSAAPGDAEEVVQVDAMCTLFQTSILDGSADPLSIWSWLFSLGFDLKFVRCSVPSETTAEAQQSAWTKLPTSAHLDYLEFIHGAADGCGADSLLTFPISELPCTERDLIGLKDLTLHAANTGLLSPESMRLRLIVLQQFNRMVIEMLPLVDLRRCDDDAGDSIGGLLRRCRPFVFRSVKRDFLTAIADITADMSWRPPVLHFNRMDLSLKHLLPDCDFVHDTFFGNAYLQMRDLSRTDLRPPRPSGTDPFLAFEVMFEGEDVVGQGGPYRQLFSDMSTELLTPFSPLFVPCPNQQGGIGDNQDMFVIRPSASASSSTMALFEFLGVILGCCIRTGVRVSLRLPPFTWKPMVLDTITPADLASVDRQTSLVLQLVATIEEDIFSDTIDETFSTPLSDRSTVLLRPHGDTQRVQCEERQEYIRLVHQARSNEAAPQVAAIRRGIDKVIPVQLLNLLLYSELELLVNGKHDVDIDLLRRHTRYSGVSPDAPHIDYFWSVLRSFSHDDRRRFIRFTWAQERLPVDDEEFLRTHTRLLIKSTSSSVSPDSRFPRADTCFFNLDLPAYSSQEILHQRLLFAITHTDSMNADVVADDPRDANIRVNDFSNMIP